MNSIIYIRVSTTEQAELGYSLKAQEELCRDFAKRYKYDILKVFIEKGESALKLPIGPSLKACWNTPGHTKIA